MKTQECYTLHSRSDLPSIVKISTMLANPLHKFNTFKKEDIRSIKYQGFAVSTKEGFCSKKSTV